jgi:transcription termination/antitermination protein NusG
MPDNLHSGDPTYLAAAPKVEGDSSVSAPTEEATLHPAPEQASEPTPDEPQEQGKALETAADRDSGDRNPPVSTEASEPESEPPAPSKKRWYVVKVQSGREDSIKEAIERRVKIDGIEEFYGQIIIPVEVVTEMRGGKRVKKEHKLYPGYLMVEVEYNDRILYLFRETSGVGDFVGHTMVGGVTRPPTPMNAQEVERMWRRYTGPKEDIAPTPVFTKPKFDRGDRLRVNDGTFAGMEGEVMEINQEKGLVKLQLTIFGRPVSVDLEFWQVEKV